MKKIDEAAAIRRTQLRRLFKQMPVEDVALVLFDQTQVWFDQVFEAIMAMRDDEDGPQDDDHLRYGEPFGGPTQEVN